MLLPFQWSIPNCTTVLFAGEDIFISVDNEEMPARLERMGCKLDLLFGRTSRQMAKLKTLLGLTISRLAVLRNQHQSRCSHARTDVAQLLRLGQQDRALLRSEQVIREQNMLDVFVIIEGYCHLLTERAALLDRTKDCPDELREAVSGLLYVATRCGELPELHKARRILASHFGSEFAAAAVELRNNCGINPKLIQKMSTRQPRLEIKIKVTKEIAAEKGIVVDLEEHVTEEVSENKKFKQPVINPAVVDSTNQQYRDAATAAQAAFESAAFAAAAARAAVELSRSETMGKGPGNQSESVSERKVRDQHVDALDMVDDYSSESEEELAVDEKEGIHLHSFVITEELLPITHTNSFFRPPYLKGEDEVVGAEKKLDQTLYPEKIVGAEKELDQAEKELDQNLYPEKIVGAEKELDQNLYPEKPSAKRGQGPPSSVRTRRGF